MNQINQSHIFENYLNEEQYDKAAEYYQSLLEEEPESIKYYWYLGLAYLLQDKEEEAQLTWFMALNQQQTEEEIDSATQELINILDQEAKRQEAKGNYQPAWLIRGHIQQLHPDNLTNIMGLIWLDATLQYPTISKFKDWNVIELLSAKNIPRVSKELIIKTLDKVLSNVSEESVDFARACLTHSQNQESIIETILAIAKKIVDKKVYISFAENLVNVCREQNPEDISLIKTLFWFYANTEHYEKALEFALDFLDKSKSLSTKIFGTNQLLYLYLKHCNWQNALSLYKSYLGDLNDLTENDHIEKFIIATLPVQINPLLYIQDKPQINRYLLNKISHRFYQIISQSTIASNSYPHLLDKKRPMRIGYIGHTFNCHSVGWLCRWLLHYHNTDKFQCYLYSMTKRMDNLTNEWFIKKAVKFYSYDVTLTLDAIQQIKDDEIDILVDLDSITLNTTCQIMALKPAPIQVTWLGFDASGIPAIDHFIADPYVLPENAQDYYSEKIWRLPHTYVGIDGFEVGVPTLKREDLNIGNDSIIFMNIQGPLKLHPDTLRLQLRILKNVPNSYLLVKGKDDQRFLQKLYAQLATEEGVNCDRLRFLGRTPTEVEHRANLRIADVILDTYPYNGATTTLETLWMEIPLVTRVGEQFAARNSYTFMINAGITEGIAWSDTEYIEWGIKLGTDENLRKEVSWKLRQSKKTSPLWNGKQFTREMEKTYQQMWEIYLQNKN